MHSWLPSYSRFWVIQIRWPVTSQCIKQLLLPLLSSSDMQCFWDSGINCGKAIAFPCCFGAKKDRGTRFSVLAAREMKREAKNERVGRGRVSFLSSPPSPRLLAPFFAWPLLRNSTETLASQATPSPVYTHLLTWIFLDNPKSASLTWVQDSTRSTLSPTESKQTDVEWEDSNMSASLRAKRPRTTLICKFHCAKQQNWMLRARAFHFCKFRCCFRPLDLYGQRMCLKIFVFNFRSPDLQTNFKSTYFWRVWI